MHIILGYLQCLFAIAGSLQGNLQRDHGKEREHGKQLDCLALHYTFLYMTCANALSVTLGPTSSFNSGEPPISPAVQ